MISITKTRCSNPKCGGSAAISFCYECGKYMCDSCEGFHSSFCPNHATVPVSDLLSAGGQFFTGRCSLPGHNNNPLQFYCKDHNVPCCVACLCTKGELSRHSGCDTVDIKDAEPLLRSGLSGSIKALEESIKNAEASLDKLQDVEDRNSMAKEEVIERIRMSFEKFRDAVDRREQELLERVNALWEGECTLGDTICSGESHLNDAKVAVDAARSAEGGWNPARLPEIAQQCAQLNELTKTLNDLCSEAKDVELDDIRIRYDPDDAETDSFVEEIQSFGNVYVKPPFSLTFVKSVNDKYSLDGPHGTVVRKVGNDGVWDCTAVGAAEIPLGKVTKWEMKVAQCTRYCDIAIGVAQADIDQRSVNNVRKCGWYFYCEDSTLHSGPPHKYISVGYGKGRRIKQGDSVGVAMDTTRGELSFTVNEDSLGVAYEGIPLDKPLVPVLCLYNTNDTVEAIYSGKKRRKE